LNPRQISTVKDAVSISKRLDSMNIDTSNMHQTISQKLSDTVETVSIQNHLAQKV